MELLESNSSSKKLNLNREIGKYLAKWPWILLSLVLFLAAIWTYLRYAEKVYLTTTSLKFTENAQKGPSIDGLTDIKSMGMGISNSDDLLTEIQVLTSKPIYKRVVAALHLQARIYSVGRVTEIEAYPGPFEIEFKTFDPKYKGDTYTLTSENGNRFRLSGRDETYVFGKEQVFPFGRAVFTKRGTQPLEEEYKVEIRTVDQAVNSLEGRIFATVAAGKGKIVEVSMNGTSPRKSELVLNELTRQYNLDGINDKNQEALATQEFIAKRLDIITNDLLGVESQKVSFKRQNEIADLEAQAQLSLQNASANTSAIMSLQTQLNLMNAVGSEINASGDRLLPSNLGLPASTETLIGEYNNMLLTRNKTLQQASKSHPAVVEMDKEMGSIRNLIRKNVSDTRRYLSQNISQLQQQVASDRGKISRMPAQEKTSREIERNVGVKEQLYLYLLQKREENAITLAVTAPMVKVVNPAYTVGQVQPNPMIALGGASIIALFLPLAFFFVKFSLNTRVERRDDVAALAPDISIVGEIPENKDADLIVDNDFSVFAEAFRILTSNLKFIFKTLANPQSPVILITSSIKGEGKTTIAMNTAISLAGSSKSVIIIGADIRNPQLKRFMPESAGLTDYLVSDHTVPTSFIHPSGYKSNLFVMHSGAIAPNPNDLLDMPKFSEMINWLKTQYDYIVIDSAPVMLVSDSLNLVGVTDTVLYVVKSHYTEEDMLQFAQEFKRSNQISNMYFVLNGVQPQDSRYGSKYGYGYYDVKTTKKGWLRL